MRGERRKGMVRKQLQQHSSDSPSIISQFIDKISLKKEIFDSSIDRINYISHNCQALWPEAPKNPKALKSK